VVDAVRNLFGVDPRERGLERGQLLATATSQLSIDLGQPACWAIKTRDVVAGPGLLAGAPRPESLGEFIELSHVHSYPRISICASGPSSWCTSVPPEGTIAQPVGGIRLRYPLPARIPPLLIGAWGPRTVALAAEIADEVKVGGTASPAVVRIIRERVAEGCQVAGRRVEDVRVVAGAVTVVAENGTAARRRARTEVAQYLAVVADLDTAGALPVGLAGHIRAMLAAGDEVAVGSEIPDEILDRFAFSGTPEHVAGLGRAVLDAGAGRVDFGTPHGLSDLAGAELLGTRVLPLLRR